CWKSSASSARRPKAARCRSGCGARGSARHACAEPPRRSSVRARGGWWFRPQPQTAFPRRRTTPLPSARCLPAGGRCGLSALLRVEAATVLRRLVALVLRVVAHHLRDTQAVLGKDAAAA